MRLRAGIHSILRRTFIVLGVLFSVAAILELTQSYQEVGATIHIPETTPAAGPLSSAKAAPSMNLSDYDAVTARPLFLATRRPYVALAPANTSKAYHQPEPQVTLELVGITIAEGKGLALVRSGKSTEIEKLSIGETIAGWRVKAIDPNSVFLSKEGLTRTLSLSVSPDVSAGAVMKMSPRTSIGVGPGVKRE